MESLRSGDWLTAARARGYSLILLVICTLAFAGWIAVSDGLIDRNGKPLGTDFSNVYAAGALTWQGQPADAYRPALQHEAEKAIFGGREVPFYGWHYPPFFFAVAVCGRCGSLCLGVVDLAGRELRRLSRDAARDPAAPGNAAGRLGVSRRLHQSRPRPERVPHRRAARRRAALARPKTLARRHPDRRARLQAAIRRADSDCAAGRPALDHDRRGRRHRAGAGGNELCRARQRRLARLPRVAELHADRRARTGRHRLGKNPVDLLGGAELGRQRADRLCDPEHAGAAARRAASRGCGTATPPWS